MTNPFDKFDPQDQAGGNAFDKFDGDAEPKARGITGMARDMAAWGVKGAIGLVEAPVGIADIFTGGRVGKALENEGGAVGFRPKQAREAVNDWHSEATKDAQRKFQEAEGIGGKFQAAIQNPSNIVGAVAESLPATFGGSVAARGLLGATRLGQAGAKATAAAEAAGLSAQASRAAGAAASQRAATIAGAAGEGITMAGSQAEAIRQETKDGLLTPAQAGIAAATGVIGGLTGGMSGRFANKLGVGDADTMLAQGAKGLSKQNADEAAAAAANPLVQQAAKSVPRQVIEGAITEGLLEELPQSVAEQLLQNLALDKPWSEGLDDAIVLGVLSGGAMGAGAAGFRGITRPGEAAPGAAPSAGPAPAPIPPGAGPDWTTEAGAAGPGAPAAAPIQPTDGNGIPYENTRIVPEWDTQPGVATAPLAGSIDMPEQAREFDTGDLELQQPAPVKPSEAMGLNPNAGALSAAAVQAVDSGASDALQAAAAQAQTAEQAARAPVPTKAQAEEIDLADIADPYERAYYESFFADAEDAQIGPEVKTWLQDDTNIPDLDAASSASDEDFLRALGANDQEITDAIASIASQPSRPQEDAQSLAGAQANEPADTRQGAGEAARTQGGQVDAGARGEADADISGVDRPGLDDAGRGAADTGAGMPETGGQPGAIARAPDAGNAQAAAVGGSGAVNDALSDGAAPKNLKEGLAAIRAKRAEEQAAQAGVNPQAEPGISQAEPGISQAEPGIDPGISQVDPGISQVEPGISQVEPGISQTEPGISQTEPGSQVVDGAASPYYAPVGDIRAVVAKQIPDMTDAEIGAAIAHYGPDHKRTGKLQKEQARRAAVSPQQGATNGTQADQAQQTEAQRAQEPSPAGNAPAAPAAPTSPKQAKAIELVNAGKAFFFSKQKADAFIAYNSLTGTHAVEQEGRSFHVRAAAAASSAQGLSPTAAKSGEAARRLGQISAVLSSGGYVQGAELRSINGMTMMRLNDDELGGVPKEAFRSPPSPQQMQAAATAGANTPAKENADAPLSANAEATMDAAPAPKPAPVKPSVKARIEAARQTRADHFAPGNIVKSYSGHDRVVSYNPPPKEGGNWSVTVQAVVKQGDAWVDAPNESQRTHSTQPGERELKVGPVEKAQAKAADAKAPASLVQAAKDNGKLEIVTVGDKKPAPAQKGIALAGWTPETGDQGNTIWTKTANSELYTATLDPAASTMEVTVLVGVVDSQIASFKVESSEQAARMASEAVARDVAETKAEKKKPAPAQEAAGRHEHAGLKIYPIKVKVGGEVVAKWAVQTLVNAEREKNGERQLGGDPIADTLDGAKALAEGEIEGWKRLEEYRADMAALDEKKKESGAIAKSKKDANKGKSIVERARDARLDSTTNIHPSFGLGTGSKRESMQMAVAQDRLIEVAMVRDEAAKKRDKALIVSGRNLPTGNVNYPGVKEYFEAAGRLKANDYEKPEYRVFNGRDSSGSFYRISKTEYDYAQGLIAGDLAMAKLQATATPAAAKKPLTKDQASLNAEIDERVKEAIKDQEALGILVDRANAKIKENVAARAAAMAQSQQEVAGQDAKGTYEREPIVAAPGTRIVKTESRLEIDPDGGKIAMRERPTQVAPTKIAPAKAQADPATDDLDAMFDDVLAEEVAKGAPDGSVSYGIARTELAPEFMTAEEAAKQSRGPAASEAWKNEGKSPAELVEERAEALGNDLMAQIAEEAAQQDFAPSDIPAAVRMWAEENNVPADSLRRGVLMAIGQYGLSDGRIKQIKTALNLARNAAEAGTQTPAKTAQPAASAKDGTVSLPKAVPEAIEDDMRKQKARVSRMKTQAAANGLDLEGRKAAQLKVAAAEATMRKMRLSIFDAEGAAPAKAPIQTDEALTPEDGAATESEGQGAEDVRFSRSTKPGPTFSPAARMQAVQAVEKTANAIRNAWANGPQVVVAFDMKDPVVPESARRADLKQRSGGARGAPEGFYYRGKVYLIASKLNTVNDAARVLFHEALGHHGLRGAFGKEMDGVLNQVATMRRAQVDAKIKEYGLRGVNALDRRAAAEEVLAEMAQTTPEIGFVKRAIAAIRNWLRANVPGFKSLAMTDNDIIEAFILPARRFVERGPGGQGGGVRIEPTMGAFSRATDQTQTDADEMLPAKNIRPLNRVEDKKKFEALVKGMARDGWTGRPVLVWKNGKKNQALTGSHRIAAARKVGIDVPVVFVSNDAAKWEDPNGMFTTFQDAIDDQRQSSFLDKAGDAKAANLMAQEDVDDDWQSVNQANPDIRFSRAKVEGVAARMGDAIKSVTATNIKERAGWKMTDWLGMGLQALGRRQLVDIYGDVLPLDEYNRLSAQMEADKNDMGAGADKLATAWGKLKDERQLAELMHDATLAQIDPDKALVDGDDRMQYRMLRGRFEALLPEAQQVYRDARAAYKEHHANVRAAIKERIERSELKGGRKADLLKRMDDELFKSVKGVYFPLSRFGRYVVAVKGADGKVQSVGRAETKPEAEALRRTMLTAFPQSQGYKVDRVILSKEFIATRDSVGRGFMTELYKVLDKQDMDAAQRAELEDTLGQLYLSALPDLSWAKHGIHRKGTPGFSQDARRAYAQNMFHGARYLAKLRYSDLMQDELTAMQEHTDNWRDVDGFNQNNAQRVVDEFNKRHESMMNPKGNPVSTALTSLGFVFHLGLSPASAMVNLSQTALVAYPVMGAKWGFGKAGAALLKASEQALKGKNDITASLTADERLAYDEAVRSGTIDVTMAHDLAGIAQGEDAGVMWKIRPVMKAASFMFHHAERFNRQVTFVAAYRLAREAGSDHASAFADATKATYDGHFDYSSGNRPRIMQGNVAKVVTLFKQYGQNMVYTLSRNAYQSVQGTEAEKKEARKVFAGLLVSHGLAAGALGLPMVTTLLAAASMLGGDDDEPWDAKAALQNLLADTFGQKTAEVMAHGLSRLTPWDVSGRVGLDRLILPDVQEGLEGQRLGEAAMTAALGPVAGIGVNMLKGLQQISEGQFERGLESMLPTALRGPLKAVRYANEGVQDKSGISILDSVSPAAVAGQALGFSPSSARNAQEGKSAILAHDRALGERRQELLTKIARATMAKDEETKAEAREEIKRFNEKNPGRRINPNHVMASVRGRQKRIDQAQDGVYLSKNRRDAMEAGRFALAG